MIEPELPREGQTKPLQISHKLVHQLSGATVKSVVDAIVELVTNSDDSYARLEQEGRKTLGSITISVTRLKGGSCGSIRIADQAEGMDSRALALALVYGEEASGLMKGKTVRGYFGRGLKEAILGLGQGEIETCKNGLLNVVELHPGQSQEPPKILRKVQDRFSERPDGTVVRVRCHRDVSCPAFRKLHWLLSNHFALRDIVQNRAVALEVTDYGGRGQGSKKDGAMLSWSPPNGSEVEDCEVQLEGFGPAHIHIWESDQLLDFVKYKPDSQAGLIIRCGSAILENTLFGLEAREPARYFFGSVDCPGIAEALRSGKTGIVGIGREGLDWRKPACQELHRAVKEVLLRHVERKARQMAESQPQRVPETLRKKFRKVCDLLNQLAKKELADEGPVVGPGGDVETLTIRPEIAYAEPGKARKYTVYLPHSVCSGPPLVAVEIQPAVSSVSLVQPGRTLVLQPQEKRPGLLVGSLEVTGRSEGDRASILCTYRNMAARAWFEVRTPGHRGRTGSTASARRPFTEITFNELEKHPAQRVRCDHGRIEIFLNFGAVGDYLGPGGEGSQSPQGSLMLAELVSEAFCRWVARSKLERGEYPIGPGANPDLLLSVSDEFMAKYSAKIHRALVVQDQG